MSKAMSRAWWLLVLVCVGIALYSGWQIGRTFYGYWQADSLYARLERAAVTGELEMGEGYVSPIDFAALWAVNPEIVGWVSIEGTDISYPIVQGEDNDRYLHVTVDGRSNASGSIFMDYRNAPDFSDSNTILYGHKMQNGSMFAGLTAYKSQSYAEDHGRVTIYLPDCTYVYEIVSAYVSPAVSDTYTVEMTEEFFGRYLRYIRQASLVSTEQTYGTGDRLLTLSTCDYTYDDARMVVHGVLVEGEWGA